MTLFARLRLVFAALALGGLVCMAPPAPAQQPSSVNPTANAVNEERLLQQLRHLRRNLQKRRQVISPKSRNRFGRPS